MNRFRSSIITSIMFPSELEYGFPTALPPCCLSEDARASGATSGAGNGLHPVRFGSVVPCWCVPAQS